MKRTISIILSLLIFCSAFMSVSAFAAEDSESEKLYDEASHLYYCIDGDSAVITGYNEENGIDENLIIPSELDGKKVVRIAKSAFREADIQSLTIPDSVTRVDAHAFSYTDIETLKIGKGLKSIHKNNLYRSFKLKRIKVSSDNNYYSVKNNILYNKDKTHLYYCPIKNGAKTFMVPSTVKVIGSFAFWNNRVINKVVFSKSVKTIKKQAFEWCFKLRTVAIPKNINSIQDRAFAFDDKLSKVTFNPNKKLELGEEVFHYCNTLKKIYYPVIYKSGGSVFSDCPITEIKFASGVKKIPNEEFMRTDIKNLKIPSGVKAIGSKAFYDCWSLKTVTVSSSVKKIGKYSLGYKTGYYDESYEDSYITKVKGFVIKGKKGSAAEKYADKNGIKFKAI